MTEFETSKLYDIAFNKFNDICNENSYHLIDIRFPGGYFIFPSEDEKSIVHFHVKECPNWIFAIWWNYDEEHEKMEGEFFCQYEPELDKFKPTRSDFNHNLTYYFDECKNNFEYYVTDVCKVFKFIHKYPLRAWACSWCGYDYRIENPSNVKILLKYLKYKFNKFKHDAVTKYCDNKQLRFVKKYIIPMLREDVSDNVEIIDCGDNCSPRYDIHCKIEDDDDTDTGCYGWWDDEGNQAELQSKWDKLYKHLQKISDIFQVLWYGCIDDCMIIWKECEQNDCEEVSDEA